MRTQRDSSAMEYLRNRRMSALQFLMLLVILDGVVFGQAMVEVNMKQGTIYSYAEETGVNGRQFYAFRTIPYAKPPVGDLRFKDPVPAGHWESPRNGSVMSPICPQVDFMNFLQGKLIAIGDEDCLYLNVFTPKPSRGSNLPVMAVIHGDGFFLGAANDFPPLPLMTRDVVYVALNYRLNTLGFLSTKDDVIPGNQGLKDMTMAFRWIRENIHDLGGDPTRVTIFGSGTGSIAAHYHMLIPQNEGLFNRVILQSGTALSPGYLNVDPRDTALKVAQKIQCPGMESATSMDLDSQALLDCLKNQTAAQLVMLSNAFYKWAILPLLFVPCIDGSYLPDHPAQLIKGGNYLKVDIMAGTTRDQGALNTRPLFGRKGQVEDLIERFSLIAPLSMYLADEENHLYLSKRAFYHYLGNSINISEQTANELTMMFGDRRFVIPLDDALTYHIREVAFGKKLYVYEFQYRGKASFGDVYKLPFGQHWISHGDDLQYLFNGVSIYPNLEDAQDFMMSDILLTLWTNFAATGNPTPNRSLGFRWAPLENSTLHLLGISISPSMQSYSRTERAEFWRNMPTKQNMILYPERFASDHVLKQNRMDRCEIMN